jgi:hypothetical protein
MFVACDHPSQDNDALLPPVPLAMGDNALNLRRSPELENHYNFLTYKRRVDSEDLGLFSRPFRECRLLGTTRTC